jgi:hypothetical protein
MNVNLALTLILGLVIQLAQVLPGAIVASSCPVTVAQSCECCPDSQSCDCARNGEPDHHAPSPALPETGSLLKVPIAKSDEPLVSVRRWKETGASGQSTASSRGEPVHGYTGVRLSVAFCSFII